jgi:hypothetical protein
MGNVCSCLKGTNAEEPKASLARNPSQVHAHSAALLATGPCAASPVFCGVQRGAIGC